MKSEIQLYIVDGSGCSPEECLHPSFCGARMEKIARLKMSEGKTQSACVELAFLLAAGSGLGKRNFHSASAPKYEYRENGKPFMACAEDGFLSLSHAGWVGLCAWAPFPVGADVEAEGHDLSQLKKRLLSPEDDETDLLKIWCLKESYVKLTGEGLSRPFPGLTARDDRILGGDGGILARVSTGIIRGYRWALCAETEFIPQIRFLTAREALDELDRRA